MCNSVTLFLFWLALFFLLSLKITIARANKNRRKKQKKTPTFGTPLFFFSLFLCVHLSVYLSDQFLASYATRLRVSMADETRSPINHLRGSTKLKRETRVFGLMFCLLARFGFERLQKKNVAESYFGCCFCFVLFLSLCFSLFFSSSLSLFLQNFSLLTVETNVRHASH